MNQEPGSGPHQEGGEGQPYGYPVGYGGVDGTPAPGYAGQHYGAPHQGMMAQVPVAYPLGYGNPSGMAPPLDGSTYVVMYGPPQPAQQPPPVVVEPEDTEFCNRGCMSTMCAWGCSYIAVITLVALLTLLQSLQLSVLALLLLAVLPAVTILTFLERRFRKSVIRMQMLITFFEAVCWMIPIVIVENVVNYVLIDATGLPKEGLCAKCILSSFLQSYVVAGLFEETVKYCAVRRIINKSYVVDPRALVVYSCCAGAAFGTVEDLMYNFSFGLGTAIVRAFTSVPLHCATGLVIGVSLADGRFLQRDTERWYKTLLLPIFVHGTYDFVTFLFSSDSLWLVGFALDIVIVVGTYLYVRLKVLVLLKSFPVEVDAHQKILNGEIEAPGCGCCSPAQCPGCYF